MGIVDDGEQLVLDGAAASWREVDGEVVVLDLVTSAYLSLNRTGSLLWPMLARGTSVAEMAAQLNRSFDVPLARATDDVRAFIDAVSAQQLLLRVPVPAR